MTWMRSASDNCVALLLAGVLAASALAATPTPGNIVSDGAAPQHKIQHAKAKKKSTKTNSVKYEKGSAETTSERDRRLFRECKGRPNAGACLGYAS